MEKIRKAADELVTKQFNEIKKFKESNMIEVTDGKERKRTYCYSQQQQCIQCLRKYNDILRCSEEVNTYVNCANEIQKQVTQGMVT